MSTKRDRDERPASSLEIAPTQYGSDISDSQAPVAPTLRAPLETGWVLSSEEPSAESAFSSQEADRYEIGAEHARGGLGRVLNARDRRLNRPVAIKELLNPDDGAEARFLREATVTARLEHPAIVPVHDIGRWKTGEPFYAMKMVSGSSLKERIDECDGLDERLALLPNVIAVADAISYAHSEGVIHRDLKPQNVVVGAFGETVVIDWGLAKDSRSAEPDPADSSPIPRSAAGLTVAGAVMGTPAYMPPEQARGDEVDERADVYSLGAMLYHLITGRAPYGRDRSEDVLSQVLSGPPPDIDPHELHAPDDLLAIVAMAMARDPADRYPSARELVADLRRFHTGKLVSARQYSTWRLILRWIASHRAVVAVVAAALIVVAVLAAVSVGRILSEKRAAEQQRIMAEKRALDLLEEKGRSELVEGNSLRALVYLSEAFSSGADTPELRAMLHDAMRTLDALELELDVADGEVVAIDIDDSSTVAIVALSSGRAETWNLDSGERIRSFETGTEHLRRIDLSPDGRRALTGSDNQGAILWNTETGERIATYPLDAYGVAAVSFSRDSARALVSMGRQVRLIDAADGAVLHDLVDETGQYCIKTTFSPDATLVGCAGGDGRGRVYDAASGALLSRLVLEGNAMMSLAFSADNQLVSGTSDRGRVSVWNPRTGALVNRLSGHRGLVLGSRFLADTHELITWGHDSTARLWNADQGIELFALRGHTEIIWDVDYHHESNRLVTASFDGSVKLWDSVAGKLIATLPTPARNNSLARFTPDGYHIITAGDIGALRVWSSRIWKPIFALHHDGQVTQMRFIDRDQLLTTADDGRVRLWDVASGSLLRQFDVRADLPPEPIVVSSDATDEENLRAIDAMMLLSRNLIGSANRSADGAELIVALGDGSLEVFDWVSAMPIREMSVHTATLRDAQYALDDTRIVTVGADAPNVLFADTGEVEFSLSGHDGHPNFLDLDSTKTRAVTAGSDKTARIWDLGSGLEVATLTGHTGAVHHARYSPDGATVLTSSEDGTARLWSAEDGAPIAVMRGHAAAVSDAQFSPDGRYIVTVSGDKTAKIWSATDGSLITSLDGHSGGVTTAGFSPDGTVVATGSVDTTALLWTVPSGRLLARLDLHVGQLDLIEVSPDGERVVTAGRDGIAVVWDIGGDERTPAEIAAVVRERVPWRLVDGRLIPALDLTD